MLIFYWAAPDFLLKMSIVKKESVIVGFSASYMNMKRPCLFPMKKFLRLIEETAVFGEKYESLRGLLVFRKDRAAKFHSVSAVKPVDQ